MIELASLINELRVVDLAKNEDETTKYFLLYKDKLFILDDSSPFRTINSRIKRHVYPHPGINKDKDYRWGPMATDDLNDFLTRMAELAPDVVAGEYYPDSRSIVVWNMSEVQPRTSINVKKIVKQLGVDNVTFRHRDEPKTDDKEIEYPPEKLLGGIPDVFFHGTNSNALKDILKFGLDPGRGPSRFASRNIFHNDHVFLSATFQEALYYAFNAQRQDKRQSWSNFPIVIELEIPDKDLLYPDYDADVSTTSKRYFPKFQSDPITKSSMKSMGISRETGKWSYKGRIPASHIRWVYYYKPFQHVWKKSRPETWTKLLMNADWEMIGHRLGLFSMDQL